LLSYPLNVRSWLTLFSGQKYQDGLESLLRKNNSRVLLIFGDSDEFTGASSYEKWIEGLESICERRDLSGDPSAAKPLNVVRIDGGSHFWRGDDLTRMLTAVETFL